MWCPADERGQEITVLYERARKWAIGSDPGLLRLRMATRTTAALACALGILFLLTRATGQPLTVALLGVVITMVAARSVNEPEPHRQRVTMALLPVPAALAITAAALLAPQKVVSDAVFVAVVFSAVYIRRFGPRGRALGMVAFMAYFFTLYLRASVSELPWMVGAVAVGMVCTFVMSTYVLPDRPERVLQATVRALRADGHRGRHHRRSGTHRTARRTAAPPYAGPHHTAQRDRPDGAKSDRRQSRPRDAMARGNQ
jgi:uncharacterized membrane protein YccC